MNERYKRAKDLFLQVCELTPKERKSILERECAGDAALRADVESLLQHHDDAHDPAEAATAASGSAPAAGNRSRIGPYRIHHELGRGGMGVVYLAVRDDDQFKRRVALKVLKRGMDTEDVLRRFELERQVLAAMNHPHIARLYDGGETEDGRPYFVMEFVEGLPLDEYCDVHRLHIDERLELFRTVCGAVHYAHQNLVVHRDLKPGNIIVSKDGVPKLLDFGIVKLINPEFSLIHGDPTAPEFRVMTPEYASPEQVRGTPITTASDIYSLGVILYELVSGHRPYHIKSRVRAELERIICDEEPDKPSTAISKVEQVADPRSDKPASTKTVTPESVARTREGLPNRLRRRIAGDIDNIVLMAMRKEPQRRYKSAEQLADDLHRHLTGMPVMARKDTLAYRTLKFIRRNSGPVAAAAVIAFLLVGGIVATSMYAQIAESNRKEAVRARDVLDGFTDGQIKLVDEFSRNLEEKFRPIAGATAARDALISAAELYYDALLQRASDSPELARYRAIILEKRGDLAGSRRSSNTGDPEKALQSYREALAIYLSLSGANPKDAALQRAVAATHLKIGDALSEMRRASEAAAEYSAALAVIEPLITQDPGNVEHLRVKFSILTAQADALDSAGEIDKGLALHEQSNQLRQQVLQTLSNDSKANRDASVGAGRMATSLLNKGQFDAAAEQYRAVLVARKRVNELEPTGRTKRDLSMAYLFLGESLFKAGKLEAAAEEFNHGQALSRELFDADPLDQRGRRDLCVFIESIGRTMRESGDFNGALISFEEALAIGQPLVEKDQTNAVYRQTVANQHANLGCVLVNLGRMDDARPHLQEAIGVYEQMLDNDPKNLALQSSLVYAKTCFEQLASVAP